MFLFIELIFLLNKTARETVKNNKAISCLTTLVKLEKKDDCAIKKKEAIYAHMSRANFFKKTNTLTDMNPNISWKSNLKT